LAIGEAEADDTPPSSNPFAALKGLGS